MTNSGLTAGDILALTKDDHRDGFLEGNGIIILILFFLIFGFGGGGFGFGGRNEVGNYVTQADLQRGFDTNGIQSKLTSINEHLYGAQYDLANQMRNDNFAIQSSISSLASQEALCCCNTQKEILLNRANDDKNTCAITTAIHNEAEETRALITANTMQELRDRLADKDRELLASNTLLANTSLKNQIVSEVRPCPVPAYITCNPFCGTPCPGQTLY